MIDFGYSFLYSVNGIFHLTGTWSSVVDLKANEDFVWDVVDDPAGIRIVHLFGEVPDNWQEPTINNLEIRIKTV